MPTVVTKTIKPAGGGDYTTLAAWETARAGSKVDTIERAECYAGNSGGLTLGVSWSLDATSHIEIAAASSDMHQGVFSTAKSHIISSGSAIHIGASSVARVRVYDMLLGAGGVGSGVKNGYTAVDVKAYRCIATGATATGGFSGVKYAENCVAYGIRFDASSSGFASVSSGGQQLLNCTAYDCGIGFFASSSANIDARNCVAQSCTDGFKVASASFVATSSNNISDIAGDAPGTNSKQGVVQFVDAANKDFHLAATDTVARGAGVNLTSSGITTDIDGDARPATGAWDVGADQVVESPTPTPSSSYGSGAKLKMMYGAYSQDRKRDDTEVLMVIEKFLEVVSG